MTLCLGLVSCNSKPAADYYKVEKLQERTATVLWNPEDFEFENGNAYYLNHYAELEAAKKSAEGAACTSWRNRQFHGRNLDWYQADYGCLIIQMPKGGNVKHANVGLLNSSTTVTKQFIDEGIISDTDKKYLPCVIVDGINDAGVAININIVPHQPGTVYNTDGDLTCQCVVRYVLDNAGSVAEAIELLSERTVRQSIVGLAGDETHYMISDKDCTAVVEFDNGEMVVTSFEKKDNGFYSKNGNPAIMTNLYDFAAERWGIGTKDFFENHPLAMGVERWNTVKDQYDNAAVSVDDNFEIAKSVWYYKHLMDVKSLWYTDNAVPTAYGKDEQGWYYIINGNRANCKDHVEAMTGYWDNAMESYWARYEENYGKLDDPHVKGNDFWETSHTVVYDLDAKVGYVIPFEGRYAADGKPIMFSIPE